MSCLEDLFDQILHSEQKAEKRKSIIKEVKTENIRCLEKIHQLETQQEILAGKLAIQVQVWNESELQLKLLSTSLDIRQTQRAQLTGDCQQLSNTLGSKDEELRRAQDTFDEEAEAFCNLYDLLSNGEIQREATAKTSLQQLIAQENQLHEELASYKSHQIKCEKLQGLILEQEETLRKQETTVTYLERNLKEEQEKCKRLEQEKAQVFQLPHNDEEFKRLQAELDGSKDEALEGACSSLQQQLQELQQLCWQKELQKKRQLQYKKHLGVGDPLPSAQTARGGCRITEGQASGSNRLSMSSCRKTTRGDSSQRDDRPGNKSSHRFSSVGGTVAHSDSRPGQPSRNPDAEAEMEEEETAGSCTGTRHIKDGACNRPNLSKLSHAIKIKGGLNKNPPRQAAQDPCEEYISNHRALKKSKVAFPQQDQRTFHF